jgi:hypothetical protein
MRFHTIIHHQQRHLFELKRIGKSNVVGSIEFMLRRCMKPVYIDLVLRDNTTCWKQGWFYTGTPAPALPTRSGYVPMARPEWSNQLTSRVTDNLQPCWMTLRG